MVRNLAEANIDVAGLILVSPALGFPSTPMLSASRTGAALNIAPQAAVAWYHKRGAFTAKSLSTVIAEAEAFADGIFAAAVSAWATLGTAERRGIAEQTSAFLGLPVDHILQADLFVTDADFRRSLLANDGLIVQGSDGRATRNAPRVGETLSVVDPDGTYDRTASIESLIRDDLGYPALGAYARDPGEIGRAWNATTARTAAVDVIVAKQMQRNTALRVLLTGGYFDTIVPYPMPLKTLTASLPASRFSHRIYAVGHGVYEDVELRRNTTDDLRGWYLRGAPPARRP